MPVRDGYKIQKEIAVGTWHSKAGIISHAEMKGNKGRNPRSKRLKFRFLPVTTINRDDEQRFLESHAFIIVSLLFYICSHEN